METGIVIIRGEPKVHNKSKMVSYIKDNQVEVVGDWFYDYRTDDSNWSFERHTDRLGFLKGCERGVSFILVEKDFFSSIGQIDTFQQKLVQEVIRKTGMDLVCVDGQFISKEYNETKDSKELFDTVKRYEKLRLTLSRIRTKQNKEKESIPNFEDQGKVSGRKSYLETDPELVRKIQKLRDSGYKIRQISDILFNMGYKNKKGNPFHTGQISKLYQQSERLQLEEE